MIIEKEIKEMRICKNRYFDDINDSWKIIYSKNMKAENKEIINQEVNEYKIKEKIRIYDTVLKTLVKFSNNSSDGNVNGILFGHESENSIVISHAFPLEKTHTQDDITNIVTF